MMMTKKTFYLFRPCLLFHEVMQEQELCCSGVVAVAVAVVDDYGDDELQWVTPSWHNVFVVVNVFVGMDLLSENAQTHDMVNCDDVQFGHDHDGRLVQRILFRPFLL